MIVWRQVASHEVTRAITIKSSRPEVEGVAWATSWSLTAEKMKRNHQATADFSWLQWGPIFTLVWVNPNYSDCLPLGGQVQHTLEVSAGPLMIKDSCRSRRTFSGRTSHLFCRDPDKQHKWIQITFQSSGFASVSFRCESFLFWDPGWASFQSLWWSSIFLWRRGPRVMDPFSSNIP